MDCKLISLEVKGNNEGHLAVFEGTKNCPFDIKRVFWIFDTKSEIHRGAHANKDSEFMLIAVNGSCKIKVDNGKEKRIIALNNPYTALYLNKMVWKEMYDFQDNAVLLIFASTYYDEKEYIRDYDEFLKEVNN